MLRDVSVLTLSHTQNQRVSRREGGVFLAPKDWAVDVDMQTQVVLEKLGPSVRQIACASKRMGRFSNAYERLKEWEGCVQ